MIKLIHWNAQFFTNTLVLRKPMILFPLGFHHIVAFDVASPILQRVVDFLIQRYFLLWVK